MVLGVIQQHTLVSHILELNLYLDLAPNNPQQNYLRMESMLIHKYRFASLDFHPHRHKC